MTFADPKFSGLVDMFGYANDVTNQLFAPVSLVALWLIVFLFLINRQYNPPECAVTAGFITMFGAIFYRLATYNGAALLNDTYMFFAVLSLLVPALWLYFTK